MVGTGGGFLTIRLGRSSLVNRKSFEGWERGEPTAIRGSCESDSLLVGMFKYEGWFTYTTAGPNRNWCEARVAIRAATFGPFSPASITDNQSRAPQRLATTRFGLNSRDSSPALISRQTWRSGLFGISRGRPRLAPRKSAARPIHFARRSSSVRKPLLRDRVSDWKWPLLVLRHVSPRVAKSMDAIQLSAPNITRPSRRQIRVAFRKYEIRHR